MPVTKVRISYGRTIQSAPYESIRLDVAIEKDLEDVSFVTGKYTQWIALDEITIFFDGEKDLIEFKNKIIAACEAFNKMKRGVINNA